LADGAGICPPSGNNRWQALFAVWYLGLLWSRSSF